MNRIASSLLLSWTLASSQGVAQVPGLVNYQGRILAAEGVFDGIGQFKFSLVNEGGSAVFWSNAPDADTDGQPDMAVSLPVAKGLFSVLLGDTTLANMASLSASAFAGGDVYLRVWFHDGSRGFERLIPDQRVAAVGYAMMAAAVGAGAVTSTGLAEGSITAGKLAPGAVGNAALADGSVTGSKLAGGAVTAASLVGTLSPSQLPSGVAYVDPDLRGMSNALAAQLAALSARVDALNTGASGLPSGLVRTAARADDPVLITEGYRVFSQLEAPGWQDGAGTGAPSPRTGASWVWTGEKLLVWGGELAAGVVSGSGAAYDPSANAWAPLGSLFVPSARHGASGVWSGTEFLVWGGFAGGSYPEDGGRYDPATGEWRALPLAGAPDGRHEHVALWTKGGMLLWSGRNASGPLDSGALYTPSMDRWTPLIVPRAPPARAGATAVWTGQRALVWGGLGTDGLLNSGGQLLFDDSGRAVEWQEIPTDGAPAVRRGHTAVWTGTVMLVWGGEDEEGNVLGDGAAFDPAKGTWSPIPALGAPEARRGHVAVWTGQEMLIFGGETAKGVTASGAAYDPALSQWRTLSNAGRPTARGKGLGVWTGRELLVFGGVASGGGYLGALERLNPEPAWYLYRQP